MVIYPLTETAQWKDQFSEMVTEYQFYGVMDNESEITKVCEETNAVCIKTKVCSNGKIAAKWFVNIPNY